MNICERPVTIIVHSETRQIKHFVQIQNISNYSKKIEIFLICLLWQQKWKKTVNIALNWIIYCIFSKFRTMLYLLMHHALTLIHSTHIHPTLKIHKSFSFLQFSALNSDTSMSNLIIYCICLNFIYYYWWCVQRETDGFTKFECTTWYSVRTMHIRPYTIQCYILYSYTMLYTKIVYHSKPLFECLSMGTPLFSFRMRTNLVFMLNVCTVLTALEFQLRVW